MHPWVRGFGPAGSLILAILSPCEILPQIPNSLVPVEFCPILTTHPSCKRLFLLITINIIHGKQVFLPVNDAHCQKSVACHLLISRSNFEKLALTRLCQQTFLCNKGGYQYHQFLHKNQKVSNTCVTKKIGTC